MPIKKTKQNRSIKKKNVRFKIDRRFLYYSIGIIIILLILFFVFYVKDKEEQKELTGETSIPKKETEGKRMETTSIPYVEKARLELISSDNKDIIKVIIDKKNPAINYKYQWKINEKTIEDYNNDSISGFKEGDTIGVTITPFREDLMGEPRFFSLTVQSTVPKVLGHTEPKIENQIMVFKILTEEKEGLSFAFNKAPKDMTINQGTGEVTWNVKDVSPGKYEAEVIIRNKKGAQVLYPLILNLM